MKIYIGSATALTDTERCVRSDFNMIELVYYLW